MTCAEVSDLIIDFLYGELGDEQRRAFEAHLATCDSCRREVASAGSTLAQARVVLAASNEPPPPAVKQGADKVAEMVARRGGRPIRTLGAPIIAEDAGGFWGLLRKPWFFPVFAAASVIGLFFLAQEAIVRRAMPLVPAESAPAGAPDQMDKAAASAAAPAARPVIEPLPAAAPAPGSPPPPAEQPPPADKRPASILAPPSAGLGGGPVAPNRWKATPEMNVPRGVVNPFAHDDNLAGHPAADSESARAAPARPVRHDLNATQDPWRAREIPRPAAGAYRVQSAPPSAAAAPDNFANRVVEPFADDKPRKRAAPPAAAEAAGGAALDVEESGRVPAAAAPAPAAVGKAEVPDTSPKGLLELGDRLFSENRLPAAAAVYRSLIARYPNHPDVPIWKARLEKVTKPAAPAAPP